MPIGIIRIVRSFGHRQLYDDYNRTKEGAIAVEYIVMDMEWNQALTFSEMVKDPVFLAGEIIQIGAINDDPETGVKAGTEGTIVDVLGNGKAFTVEFFDEDGNTIEASLYTEYTPAQLQKVETALTLT